MPPLSPANAWYPPSETDSRSPCPALNALANHNYLPRNGRRLGLWQLMHTMSEVYNISLPLGFVLAMGGILMCGSWWRLSLDLHDLAKHDYIEHDASLTRRDALPGSSWAPTNADRSRLEQLLNETKHPYLALHDFANARADRESILQRKLTTLHQKIALGEVALTLSVLGVSGGSDQPDLRAEEHKVVPKDWIREWLGEDRLPEKWQKPFEAVGLSDINGLAKETSDRVERIKAERGKIGPSQKYSL